MVITVFTVFRLLTDFVCLYTYEFWLSLCKIARSSVILLLPLFNEYICSSIHFNDLAFKHSGVERHLMKVILSVTWWRLFWASLDEGHYERHLMKVILSVTWWRSFWASLDEGHSERTWWRLFSTCVVRTKFDIYLFIFVNKIRY
jgi:hypothetical protein